MRESGGSELHTPSFFERLNKHICVKPFSRPLRRRVSEDYIECIST